MNSSSIFESSRRLTGRLAVVLLAGLLGAPLVGCESDGPPSSWEKADPNSRTDLFEMRHSHPTPVDLEGFYLTQPADEAVEHLKTTYCKNPVRRESQYGDDAYFLGCKLEDHPDLTYLRIGIWPRIGNRIATIEIQRKDTKPATVYDQFKSMMGEPVDHRLEPRLIEFITEDHRMFADWDSGLDGPAHIVVGLDPDWSAQ